MGPNSGEIEQLLSDCRRAAYRHTVLANSTDIGML